MKDLKFNLNDPVVIDCSGTQAVVIGRSESLRAEPQYFLRFVTPDGCAREEWWSEEALRAAA